MVIQNLIGYSTGNALKQYHNRLFIVQLTQDLTAVIEVIDNKIIRSQADFSFKQSLKTFKQWKGEILNKVEVKDGKKDNDDPLQGSP